MQVLVTRPQPQADEWVERMREQSQAAQALPLIHLGPVPDLGPVYQHWANLAQYRLVLFISPNAVRYFFATKPAHLRWPAGTQAASAGPGTSLALQACGLAPSQVIEPAPNAPQFDSEALWQALQHQSWRGAQALLVRAHSGRDWLRHQLREQGAIVHTLAVYQRSTPQLSPCEQACLQQALAEPQNHVWFFSSSEAIQNLRLLAPHMEGHATQAVVTHPRIAEQARQLGMGHVHLSRPLFDAVMACIQSLH